MQIYDIEIGVVKRFKVYFKNILLYKITSYFLDLYYYQKLTLYTQGLTNKFNTKNLLEPKLRQVLEK
jgi:hypothetical protein